MRTAQEAALAQGVVFEAASLSPRQVAAALRERGAVLVRGALDAASIEVLETAAIASSRSLAEMIGRPVNDMPICFSDPATGQAGGLSTWNGGPYPDFPGALAESGMDRSWYYEGRRNYKIRFWENGASFPNVILGLVLRSRLLEIATTYFGDDVVSPYSHNTVRYQSASISDFSYAFHQDGSFHSRHPDEHAGLTIWAPFTPCGVDAPGLEVSPYRIDRILPPPAGVAEPYLFIEDGVAREACQDRFWRPVMDRGDVLIFDHFAVHRSAIDPGMSRTRYSADVRLFAKHRLPAFVRDSIGWLPEFPSSPGPA
ncbi:phytanoyl-CoA dioxygenase family protein [Phenylobacterium sp.]|uniref:phytanoyl-CoA dioxygenase family protein n=1 Tax=Phenylobacterium sp. TaxID=1871053 RepID=UPI002C2C3B0D|nr:phytanoyl-CoA dioxygenase family protein [Phenylobacterium sp.]HVI31442.1 phytanoyl-CoA dioxygenase family protein [Phenylobacterium sp.]